MRSQLVAVFVGACALIAIIAVMRFRHEAASPLEPAVAVDDSARARRLDAAPELAEPALAAASRAPVDSATRDGDVTRFQPLFLVGTAHDEDNVVLGANPLGDRSLWLDVYLRKEAATGGQDVTTYSTSERVRFASGGRMRVDSGLRRQGDAWRGLDASDPRQALDLGLLESDAYIVVFLRRGPDHRDKMLACPVGGFRVGRLAMIGTELDVGDITIEPWPSLVAGQVVDTLDRPIENARVTVIRLRGPGKREVWKPIDEVATTDAGGWFRFESNEHPDSMRVLARADGYESELVPFVIPETRNLYVALRMRTLGGLRGALALEPDLAAGDLQVALRDDYGTAITVWPRDDGSFSFDSMLIGAYRLEIGARRTGFVLHAIDGVRVTEGSVSSDPRIESIDVRGRWTRVEATIVVRERGPLGAERVRVEDETGQGGVLVTQGDGRLIALVPRGTEQLFALAPGYKRVSFMNYETLVLAP